MRIPGALEFEALRVTDQTPGIAAEVQDLRGIGTGWSGDAQLFVRAGKPGDFVEVAIPATDSGAKRMVLYATRASDYGLLKFTVNGKVAGQPFDGYAEKPAPSGPISLGVHEPRDGMFVLRVEVVGTSPASTGSRYFFGLDAVLLETP
jgi:hypothetical protein